MRVHLGYRRIFPYGRPALLMLCACLTAFSLGQPCECVAQADSLSKIDVDYEQQKAKLDRERIERLTRLAQSQGPGEAELTYLEIFRFAVATDRYADAQPAADRVIQTGTMTREADFLARLIKIIAEADRGDYDGSMRDLRAFLSAPPPGQSAAPGTQTHTILAIGEAYFRRLVRAKRFDLAREVCDSVVERANNPAVRDHFLGYRRRLDLVGKPAPEIRGTDVDGSPLKLDALKGKVVLVVFWATWCPPCVERLPVLTRALELHEKDGFVILGVNLDTEQDREQLVRRFIVDFGVRWPSIMDRQGEQSTAKQYGVAEIPANVLIGRDQKIITIDVDPTQLLHSVAEALKRPDTPR